MVNSLQLAGLDVQKLLANPLNQSNTVLSSTTTKDGEEDTDALCLLW